MRLRKEEIDNRAQPTPTVHRITCVITNETTEIQCAKRKQKAFMSRIERYRYERREGKGKGKREGKKRKEKKEAEK